jgi:MSHA biogenesis protein MshN
VSLINQMLQDLEKRQGEKGLGGQLPPGVHSAPAQAVDRRRLWVLLLIALLVAVYAAYDWRKPGPTGATPAPAASAPATPVAPAPTQAPVAAADPPVVPPPVTQLTDGAPASAPPRTLPPEAASAKPLAAKPASKNTDSAAEKREKEKPRAREQEREKKLAQAAASAPKAPPKPVAPEGNISKNVTVSEPTVQAEQAYREALAAFFQGRTADSQAEARRALAIDSRHAGARQLLVRQLIEQGATDQARSVLREGTQLQPGQVTWATWLVRLELDRGDTTAARQAIDGALPGATGNAQFQALAGAVAQRQGKAEEAAGFYRSALMLKPDDGRSWVGLGLALEAQEHGPESREAFRRALATESLPPDLEALAQRKTR